MPTNKRPTKPRVIVRSVADRYASPDERILEVSFANGAGCLISLRRSAKAQPQIEVYRTDDAIKVIAPKGETTRQAAVDAGALEVE